MQRMEHSSAIVSDEESSLAAAQRRRVAFAEARDEEVDYLVNSDLPNNLPVAYLAGEVRPSRLEVRSHRRLSHTLRLPATKAPRAYRITARSQVKRPPFGAGSLL
jgi:hypothetical protein